MIDIMDWNRICGAAFGLAEKGKDFGKLAATLHY